MDEKRPRKKAILDEHGDPIHPDTLRIHKAAKAAIAVLEKAEGYPAVQRDVGTRLQAEFEKTGKHLPRPSVPNEDRLKYELTVYDILAEDFLKLVSDLPSQKSYLAMLLSWASDVWDRYRGFAPINADEDNPVVQEINSHRSRWAIAGWDRIAPKTVAGTVQPADSLVLRMERAASLTGIAQLCHQADISPASYHKIRNGTAGKKVISKVELFLSRHAD